VFDAARGALGHRSPRQWRRAASAIGRSLALCGSDCRSSRCRARPVQGSQNGLSSAASAGCVSRVSSLIRRADRRQASSCPSLGLGSRTEHVTALTDNRFGLDQFVQPCQKPKALDDQRQCADSRPHLAAQSPNCGSTLAGGCDQLSHSNHTHSLILGQEQTAVLAPMIRRR